MVHNYYKVIFKWTNELHIRPSLTFACYKQIILDYILNALSSQVHNTFQSYHIQATNSLQHLFQLSTYLSPHSPHPSPCVLWAVVCSVGALYPGYQSQ